MRTTLKDYFDIPQKTQIEIIWCLDKEDLPKDTSNMDDLISYCEFHIGYACVIRKEIILSDIKRIFIFPKWIFHEFKTQDKLIAKLNYSLVHELIHLQSENDNEEITHALSMLICEDMISNRSDYGFNFLRTVNKSIIKLER